MYINTQVCICYIIFVLINIMDYIKSYKKLSICMTQNVPVEQVLSRFSK